MARTKSSDMLSRLLKNTCMRAKIKRRVKMMEKMILKTRPWQKNLKKKEKLVRKIKKPSLVLIP